VLLECYKHVTVLAHKCFLDHEQFAWLFLEVFCCGVQVPPVSVTTVLQDCYESVAGVSKESTEQRAESRKQGAERREQRAESREQGYTHPPAVSFFLKFALRLGSGQFTSPAQILRGNHK
jgi:hypothetical protein